jgi:hypothetical protein
MKPSVFIRHQLVKWYPWLVLITAGATIVVGLAQHEMWRDELEPWMIATHSTSWGNLLTNIGYEYHPGLWYALLFMVAQISHHPVMMQLLHGIIALATIAIILWWAPFSRLIKTLLVFGYFVIFEYAVISRSYGMGVLLALAFCALYGRAKKPWIILGGVIFLLTQTSMLGLVLALGLIGYVIIDYGFAPNLRQYLAKHWPRLAIGAGLAVAGFIVCSLQLAPKPDAGFVARTSSWVRSIGDVWGGYVPLPAQTAASWNTNLVDNLDLRACLSVGFVVVFSLFLRRHPRVLAFYLGTTTALVLLYRYVYPGSTRHHGYTFIVLIMALWLAWQAGDRQLARWRNPLTLVVLGLLIVQVLAAAVSYYKDHVHQFSQARLTAQYLKISGLNELPIVGHGDYQTSSVAAYLDKSLWYPQIGDMGSFVVWNMRRSTRLFADETLQQRQILDDAYSLSQRSRQDVVVLMTDYRFGAQYHYQNYQLVLQAVFDGTTLAADEQFYVYKFMH